jgi:hypothetical protein
MSTEKKKPTWNNLKKQLSGLDRKTLINLIKDLYTAGKDNQSFLNARFGLGEDVLDPYKRTIYRWACPDVLRNQEYSVSKAKKAVSDYKKALGNPEGLAELSVFYCEACAELLGYCGIDDETYFNACVQMFEQALKYISGMDPDKQNALVKRLVSVQSEGHKWGWGVGDSMDDLMIRYGFDE